MKGLTKRQNEVLEFIKTFINTNNYSPSYNDIRKHFSFSSPAAVYKHLQALKRKGWLQNEYGCSRSITIIEEKPLKEVPPFQEPATVKIALIGSVCYGFPIETFSTINNISLPTSMVDHPDSTYALQVKDNSLAKENMNQGDILIVEGRTEVEAAEVIIGMVDAHETLIKRYYPEGQYLRLESLQNEEHPIIISSEALLIQGVITALFRSYNL